MSTVEAPQSLSPDFIQGLLKKHGRTRGEYEAVLKNFLSSGEAGIEVPLNSGAFAGRTGGQVKIGFDNARKRVDNATGQAAVPGGHAIKVVKVGKDPKEGETPEEQHVYLIDTSKVAASDE